MVIPLHDYSDGRHSLTINRFAPEDKWADEDEIKFKDSIQKIIPFYLFRD